MNKVSLCIAVLALTAAPAYSQAPSDHAVIVEKSESQALAKSHEEAFKNVNHNKAFIVLQRGERYFTIREVTGVEAVGSLVIVTVRGGAVFTVSPRDILFSTDSDFHLKE